MLIFYRYTGNHIELWNFLHQYVNWNYFSTTPVLGIQGINIYDSVQNHISYKRGDMIIYDTTTRKFYQDLKYLQ